MMTMLKKSSPASLGLLALTSLACLAQLCSAEHPLLKEKSLRRLGEINSLHRNSLPEFRCNLYVEALRDILEVPQIKASGRELIVHALQVLDHKDYTRHLLKDLKHCVASDVGAHMKEGANLVGSLADKAMLKLGGELGGYGRYGSEFLAADEHLRLRRPHHLHSEHLAHGFGHNGIGIERLYEDKRRLERALEAKMIDLNEAARTIKHLRHEVHELSRVASGQGHELTMSILDRASYEALRLEHETALKREHHLRRTVHELEQELSATRRHHLYGSGHVGAHLGSDHTTAMMIVDPIEQASLLSYYLLEHGALNHHGSSHHQQASQCYRYYLLFSYPGRVSRETIETVARLPVRVNTMKQFFKLIDGSYLHESLRAAERLRESLDESVRRVGHEMHHCLKEAEEYLRHHKVHFKEHFEVGAGHHLGGHVLGHLSGLSDLELEHHHSSHHHSSPTGSSSTSTSTSTSGSGAAAAASAGSSAASASAGAAAAATSAATSANHLSSIPALH